MDITKYTDSAMEMILAYGPKLILAILFLFVGFWIIKVVVNMANKTMEKREVDPSLRPFATGLLGWLLKAMLIISVLGMIGIEMTSFIAVLGAAGLAIGMALSGTLQNFAGGVLLLIFKPIKVGDFIEAQGHSGTVKEIQIFVTILTTPDNKTIFIANSPLATGSIVNFSTEPIRRVDFTFGIGYGDDIDKAKTIIRKIVDADSRVLKDPEPFIAVKELGDSSVNLVTRVWVNAADYWAVFFDTTEFVKKSFDKEGVSIPFPQMDVHLDK